MRSALREILCKGVWYFSHPRGTQEEGKALFDLAKKRLNTLLDEKITTFCPMVVAHLLQVEKPRPAQFWYDYHFGIMDKFDGIIVAPGWMQARQCLLEFGHFKGRKLPHFFYADLFPQCPTLSTQEEPMLQDYPSKDD